MTPAWPRAAVTAVLAAVALAAPGAASAHSSAPTVALDVRLRVDPIRGVTPTVIDGNRRLRLTVAPGVGLVVRGLLGEPVLRFGDDGVWVNLGSPTASADRITSRRGSGWLRLTRSHSFTWHDHRLAAPPGRPAGTTAPFALPVFVDGQTRTISGVFTYVHRPAWWAWLAALAAALVGVLVLARRLAGHRYRLAWVLALAAAAGALVANLGFATAGWPARSRSGRRSRALPSSSCSPASSPGARRPGRPA